MNKKNFKVKLLVICLIGALLTSHMIIAMASSTGEVKTTVSNSLLKLVYEISPTEVNLAPSSLGTAGDGKITGIEAGKLYKVTVNDEINYSKSDGSLTTNKAETEPLTGTEIIGLTNGVWKCFNYFNEQIGGKVNDLYSKRLDEGQEEWS